MPVLASAPSHGCACMLCVATDSMCVRLWVEIAERSKHAPQPESRPVTARMAGHARGRGPRAAERGTEPLNVARRRHGMIAIVSRRQNVWT